MECPTFSSPSLPGKAVGHSHPTSLFQVIPPSELSSHRRFLVKLARTDRGEQPQVRERVSLCLPSSWLRRFFVPGWTPKPVARTTEVGLHHDLHRSARPPGYRASCPPWRGSPPAAGLRSPRGLPGVQVYRAALRRRVERPSECPWKRQRPEQVRASRARASGSVMAAR
jgi:hypothetical protein